MPSLFLVLQTLTLCVDPLAAVIASYYPQGSPNSCCPLLQFFSFLVSFWLTCVYDVNKLTCPPMPPNALRWLITSSVRLSTSPSTAGFSSCVHGWFYLSFACCVAKPAYYIGGCFFFPTLVCWLLLIPFSLSVPKTLVLKQNSLPQFEFIIFSLSYSFFFFFWTPVLKGRAGVYDDGCYIVHLNRTLCTST